MKRIFLGAVALAFGSVSTGGLAAITLTNGSFEDIGQLYSPALGGLYESVGWVNTSSLNIQASSALAGAEGTPAAAATGARFLRLVSDDPTPQNTGFIHQALGTLEAGQAYTISGDAFGGDSINNLFGALFTLSSQADGGQVYASGSVAGLARGAFTSFSLSVTGDAANAGQSVFLRFAAVPSGFGQNIRGGIDNVRLSVAVVPEPASWTLMIGGFGLVGAALRNRKAVSAAA